jgi:hypothetical protein
MCAWCGRRRIGSRWVDTPHTDEPRAASNVEPLLTHSICPSCFDRTARAAEQYRRVRDET